MATNIFDQLGFSFNKSSVTSVVQSTNIIKDSIINLGPVFANLQDQIDDMTHVSKWVGLGTAASNVFGGIKAIASSVAGDIVFPWFKKNPYKISFAKIPYFLRDGKRLSSKKIRKIQ